MSYMGDAPFPGLTPAQAVAIEAACRCAPPSAHDGLWRGLLAQLGGGGGPWSDATVTAAMRQVLLDGGIPSPYL